MVLCKGEEFDNMMADLMKYRESTIRQCDLLLECEGNVLRKSMQSSVQRNLKNYALRSALVLGPNQRTLKKKLMCVYIVDISAL